MTPRERAARERRMNAKADRLKRDGKVHEPAADLTRWVTGDTGGPYLATVAYITTGEWSGWTGRCSCKDGIGWQVRERLPRLEMGEGCSHLRVVLAQARALGAEQPVTRARHALGLDPARVFAHAPREGTS